LEGALGSILRFEEKSRRRDVKMKVKKKGRKKMNT